MRTFFVGDRAERLQPDAAHLVGKLPDERRARVTSLPETGDVARYFVAADVFVCTSRVESYPRVILEAMAHGLPIVTTPVFGIREQVREDVNGVFYDPGDVAGAGRRDRTARRRRCAARSDSPATRCPRSTR